MALKQWYIKLGLFNKIAILIACKIKKMATQITLLAQPNGTYKLSKSIKKKKSIFKIAFIKVKVIIWNLSPLHWFDDFKEINVNLEEFANKKAPKN